MRERLISRKIAGGLSRQEAEAFYARTDGPNVERVLVNSRQANLIVEMTEEGRYHFKSWQFIPVIAGVLLRQLGIKPPTKGDKSVM